MNNDMNYDVLVVGARCAGASTAMLLARYGLRVLAIDRGDYGTDTISTHALMRGAVTQLHRWGVLPVIARRGTPPVRRVIFRYGTETEEVAIRPSPDISALYAPRRTVLDAALVDAARAAGAEIRHGHTLIDLLRRDDGRVVGATIQDGSGQRSTIHTGLVVGADGLASLVARQVGAGAVQSGQHACSFVFGYVSGLNWDGYRWAFSPGVSAGFIPTNDGAHCVFAAMPPDRFRSEIRQDLAGGFRTVLSQAAPDMADQVMARMAAGGLAGHLRVFAGQKGFLRQAQGPGWALVGDSGYFKDPIIAHGITDALRDAELLARAAARGTDAALAEYAATRDALSRQVLEVGDAIASFEWDLTAVRAHHRVLHAAMKQETAFLNALPPAPVVPGTITAIAEQEKAA